MFASSISQQVNAINKSGEALTPLEEASLVMYQLPSAEEMLPILSILPEVTSLHNTSPTLSKCFGSSLHFYLFIYYLRLSVLASFFCAVRTNVAASARVATAVASVAR